MIDLIYDMKKIKLIIIGLISSLTIANAQESFKTDTFSFSFEGKRLHGFIDIPLDYKPDALIIIVGGHGKTNYGYRDWYNDSLFTSFTNQGLTCVRWDKAGCGKSDGKYNHNQTIQNSAKEILAAIEELKKLKVIGVSKIGLWSGSRGGWIAPLVISDYSSIAFWISVCGGDGLDSWPYQLESNLRFAGKSDSVARELVEEFLEGGVVFENGGTYEDWLEAEKNFSRDSFCLKYIGRGEMTEEAYYREQKQIMKNPLYPRDSATNLYVLVPDFKNVLNQIDCPVLAIYGEKDYVVDWRKTIPLYKETIGEKSNLTIKSFPNGNHALLKCKTGASNEKLENPEFCDEYFETMVKWISENGYGE